MSKTEMEFEYMKKQFLALTIFVFAATTIAHAAPSVAIRLPERIRLLTDQQVDLRVEASGLSDTNAQLAVLVNGVDITSQLPAPEVSRENDANTSDLDKAWTFRKVSFDSEGVKKVEALVTDSGTSSSATARIGVQRFELAGIEEEGGDGKHGDSRNHKSKSIILFLGDGMGTSYRDVARIVAQSTSSRFRQGFFDELLEMDRMPVSGMVMTYSLDRVVPDSANTATAWSTGNKTIDGALGVFPDNTDWKFNAANLQATKQYALDNPRVETLWEYLKRRYGYKTGIVTTADVTDATPGGEGAHTITRSLGHDIARQYVDGVFTTGTTFDVILGGGRENFDARTLANSGDTRNLIHELAVAGYTYVNSRTALNALPAGNAAPGKLLGLFRTSHMNVAYDKLGLVRPTDEPTPNFDGFPDQPMLDEMAAKAIATLSKGDAPFILLVEGASIDKQSHHNNAAGVIWDVIEFDKAVGVGREFARTHGRDKTLVLTMADHDQSMHILGLVDTGVPMTVLNTRSQSVYPRTMSPYDPIVGNSVAPDNEGHNVGEVGGFPDYVDANGDRYPENTNRHRIEVGFRTGNHTASSVPITAEGAGALLFTGYFDQTDIFFKMARVLSSKTHNLDAALEEKRESDALSQNY